MFFKRTINELKDKIGELENRNIELYKQSFREGDLVYITNGKIGSQTPVYLRKAYNGGECYYWTRDNDDRIIEDDDQYGVNILKISTTKPPVCDCCGQIIK